MCSSGLLLAASFAAAALSYHVVETRFLRRSRTSAAAVRARVRPAEG